MNIIILKSGQRTKGRRTFVKVYGQVDPFEAMKREWMAFHWPRTESHGYQCVITHRREYLYDFRGRIVNQIDILTE